MPVGAPVFGTRCHDHSLDAGLRVRVQHTALPMARTTSAGTRMTRVPGTGLVVSVRTAPAACTERAAVHVDASGAPVPAAAVVKDVDDVPDAPARFDADTDTVYAVEAVREHTTKLAAGSYSVVTPEPPEGVTTTLKLHAQTVGGTVTVNVAHVSDGAPSTATVTPEGAAPLHDGEVGTLDARFGWLMSVVRLGGPLSMFHTQHGSPSSSPLVNPAHRTNTRTHTHTHTHTWGETQHNGPTQRRAAAARWGETEQEEGAEHTRQRPRACAEGGGTHTGTHADKVRFVSGGVFREAHTVAVRVPRTKRLRPEAAEVLHVLSKVIFR